MFRYTSTVRLLSPYNRPLCDLSTIEVLSTNRGASIVCKSINWKIEG